MPDSSNLLIVHHSQSGSTDRMASFVLKGARSEEVSGVDVREKNPLKANSADLLWADALIIGTPENFGYMSGAIKYFLDRVYYPCEGRVDGMAHALFVSAGNDGTGAVASVRRILSGLSMKEVQEPVIAAGGLTDTHLEACEELGMTLAAGLEHGIF